MFDIRTIEDVLNSIFSSSKLQRMFFMLMLFWEFDYSNNQSIWRSSIINSLIKFVLIRIILALIINIFSNRSILSFWDDVYEANRFVTILRILMKSRYSNLKIRSSFIRINRTIWSYLIRIVFKNSRITEKASFVREWV
jgi:hypothetical protein